MEKRTEMKNRGMPPLHLAAARKNKRGVSPIIATILLVAITVVIAAVLYVLVSGYLSGGASAPMSIQLAQPSGFTQKGATPSASSCGATGTADYLVTFGSVTATSGLTTAMFGLKILDVNKVTVPLGCANLYNSGGTSVAIYFNGAWSTTVSVANGDTLVLDVGASSLAGTGDTVVAFGLGSNSVSGGYAAGF